MGGLRNADWLRNGQVHGIGGRTLDAQCDFLNVPQIGSSAKTLAFGLEPASPTVREQGTFVE